MAAMLLSIFLARTSPYCPRASKSKCPQSKYKKHREGGWDSAS